MIKQGVKTTRKKTPKQVFWTEEVKTQFEALIQRYDPDLTASTAIMKLIKWAIKENWMPGYIRQEQVIRNKLARDTEDIEQTL